jgi:hypothetical protein
VAVYLAMLECQARVKDWQEARAIVALMRDDDWYEAMGRLACLQAETHLPQEARKTLETALVQARSLRTARNLPNEVAQDRALVKLAMAQANMGDLKEALRIAQSCHGKQLRDPAGRQVSFPSKEQCLVELLVRSGDLRRARQVVDGIDEDYPDEGDLKGELLTSVARAYAQAHESLAALETVRGIRHDYRKTLAYIEIARVLAQTKDLDGARRTFAHALELAQKVPITRYNFRQSDYARPPLLEALAAAQAEAKDTAAAQAWIDRLEQPYLKAWALAGLAKGESHTSH